MKATIDKVGRVVIPAAIRERAGLVAGTEVDAVLDDFSVRLVRTVLRPEIVEVDGRLIARPTAPAESLPAVDLGAMNGEERGRWGARRA